VAPQGGDDLSMETFYRDGTVAQICGDSKSVLRAIKSNSFDLLVTDPPYG